MFTLTQLGCIVALWVVKSTTASLAFPFILIMTVPLRRLILSRVFEERELQAVGHAAQLFQEWYFATRTWSQAALRYLFYTVIFIYRKRNTRKTLACFHVYHALTFCKINNWNCPQIIIFIFSFWMAFYPKIFNQRANISFCSVFWPGNLSQSFLPGVAASCFLGYMPQNHTCHHCQIKALGFSKKKKNHLFQRLKYTILLFTTIHTVFIQRSHEPTARADWLRIARGWLPWLDHHDTRTLYSLTSSFK